MSYTNQFSRSICRLLNQLTGVQLSWLYPDSSATVLLKVSNNTSHHHHHHHELMRVTGGRSVLAGSDVDAEVTVHTARSRDHVISLNAVCNNSSYNSRTVSRNMCEIVLSELRQISSNFYNFWHEACKKDERM